MNEEQRKAGTIDVLAQRNNKEKDYSKYFDFEHVYQPPSLKRSQKAWKRISSI